MKHRDAKPERRFIQLAHGAAPAPELRAAGDDDGRNFVGHFAVFNSPTEIWGFWEQVGENAFDRAVNGDDDVRFLINHDASLLLARNKFGEGTLDISTDKVGGVAEAPLGGQSYADDLVESLDRGDIDQMSFGFRVLEDSWEEKELDTELGPMTVQLRTLDEVQLLDVSVVTFPAYQDTDAALRYLGLAPLGELMHTKDVHELVRDASRGKAFLLEDLVEAITRSSESWLDEEGRAGKVLSAKNRELVQSAVDALQALLEAAEEKDAGGVDETRRLRDLFEHAVRARFVPGLR